MLFLIMKRGVFFIDLLFRSSPQGFITSFPLRGFFFKSPLGLNATFFNQPPDAFKHLLF